MPTGSQTCEQPRPVGRPLGEVAQAVLDALSRRPMTARDLALSLRCSLAVVMDTCKRLRQAGRIEVAGHEILSNGTRPVARYRLRQPDSLPRWPATGRRHG